VRNLLMKRGQLSLSVGSGPETRESGPVLIHAPSLSLPEDLQLKSVLLAVAQPSDASGQHSPISARLVADSPPEKGRQIPPAARDVESSQTCHGPPEERVRAAGVEDGEGVQYCSCGKGRCQRSCGRKEEGEERTELPVNPKLDLAERSTSGEVGVGREIGRIFRGYITVPELLWIIKGGQQRRRGQRATPSSPLRHCLSLGSRCRLLQYSEQHEGCSAYIRPVRG
jgi:hypothetical protein